MFPNISSCYSIIPNDFKKIDWKNIIEKLHKRLKEQSDDKKLLLLDNNFKELTCLVSLSISKILINSFNKNMNSLLVDNNGRFNELSQDQRPRIKNGIWIVYLSGVFKNIKLG